MSFPLSSIQGRLSEEKPVNQAVASPKYRSFQPRLYSLSERFEMVREAGKNVKNKSPTPKTQKVIFLLLNDKDFEKYYEPRVISLGPIHDGKPKYQLGEKYKLVLTSEFIESSGKSMEEVHKKIQDNIKELRDCFEKEVTMDYNDEALAWLLFLDGCAILHSYTALILWTSSEI